MNGLRATLCWQTPTGTGGQQLRQLQQPLRVQSQQRSTPVTCILQHHVAFSYPKDLSSVTRGELGGTEVGPPLCPFALQGALGSARGSCYSLSPLTAASSPGFTLQPCP